MAGTALAFAVALASALLPVLNIELYLLGAASLSGGPVLSAMAVAAAAGQTLGKVAYYYLGRGVLDLPWLRRRAATTGRWGERIAGLRAKAEGRPWWTAGLVAVSSFASIPPFMVVCVLAGTVRMPVWAFVAVTMATRSARFLLLVFAPGTAMALLPG
ncbi:VTT domain-containing protein [Nocardiopsis sediminis]|uniref:VTT domain-containing protein n=1 Tax=Nocardiopsis sediminis TaxID=1778267 RepID=A0ABV8FUH1_9ACTN